MIHGQGNVQVHTHSDETRDKPTVYGVAYGQRISGSLIEQHIDGLDIDDLVDLRDLIDWVLDPETTTSKEES